MVVKSEGALLGTPVVVSGQVWMEEVTAETLRPWARRYATWLACQPKRPTQDERQKKLSSLTLAAFPREAMLRLEQRDDFKSEVAQQQNDDLALARAVVQQGSAFAMQAHMDAISWAVEERSYKEIGRLTIPIMDRVWQKNSDAPGGSPQVVINIGAQSFAAKLLRDGEEIVIPEAQVEIVQGPDGP